MQLRIVVHSSRARYEYIERASVHRNDEKRKEKANIRRTVEKCIAAVLGTRRASASSLSNPKGP